MNKSLTSLVKEYGILLVLIVLVVAFSIASPQFMQVSNLFNITKQIATLGICAVGFTFVLITAGIDLSLGYQISLDVVVCGYLMAKLDVPWGLAIVLTLLLGTAIGFANGFIIAKTGVAPLIVTLSMMTMLNGASYLISKGLPIIGFPDGFAVLGQGAIGPVPVPLIFLVAVWALGVFILNKTYFGRYFYALGSNPEAARLSGVSVSQITILVYSLCGFFTAIGAILLLSRLNSAQSNMGAGFEFSVLTACVLGGISVMGGKGRMFGAFMGVLIVGVLDNGLVLLNISEYVQLIVKGAILLAAVIYDTMSKTSADKVKKIKAINVENA